MKLVSLMSSGIDSPVATYLVAQQGADVVLIHGELTPFSDEQETKKFLAIVQQLKQHLHKKTMKIYLVPHGHALERYKQKGKPRFTCVFCKRMMVRYAEAIAQKENAQALVMGDSLGQVASQTLQNIKVVEDAVSLPILRPLLGLDKNDVVRIAKEIGTYDLSIAPSVSCQAVPHKPATKATRDQLKTEEKNMDISALTHTAMATAKIITL